MVRLIRNCVWYVFGFGCDKVKLKLYLFFVYLKKFMINVMYVLILKGDSSRFYV